MPRAVKVFAECDLSTLAPWPTPDWHLESMANVGPERFAALMVRAAVGDPFSESTPESAADDLREFVQDAGAAFRPDAWLAVSDDAGEIGVVLPQAYADAPGTGTLFYVAVLPGRRGAGHGTTEYLTG